MYRTTTKILEKLWQGALQHLPFTRKLFDSRSMTCRKKEMCRRFRSSNLVQLLVIIHLVKWWPACSFIFMHLADTFIQSDLHCIQVTVFTFYQLLLSLGIEPMILALLAPCSTIWATGKLFITFIHYWSRLVPCALKTVYFHHIPP